MHHAAHCNASSPPRCPCSEIADYCTGVGRAYNAVTAFQSSAPARPEDGEETRRIYRAPIGSARTSGSAVDANREIKPDGLGAIILSRIEYARLEPDVVLWLVIRESQAIIERQTSRRLPVATTGGCMATCCRSRPGRDSQAGRPGSRRCPRWSRTDRSGSGASRN